MTKRGITTIMLCAALLGAGSTASADNLGAPKVGPWMFNFHIGPVVGINGYGYTSGAIVLDFGYALDGGRNAYLLFPFQVEFAEFGAIIMVPLGFQYDIKLPVNAVGLYLTPRFVAGYAAATGGGNTFSDGFIMPEFGIKAVFMGRWNAGFTPISVPIFFGQTGTFANWRILFYGGVNF
jgi:hypothetical protein